MWLAALLVVAFVVWHFIPRPDPNRPNPRFRKETRAVESDPGWAKFIEEHCESPAETAFLRAMILAHDLKPAEGSLVGARLRLDFQVEEGRYRVDFLANKWLVVEIDGAAYHSSPQAIERDQIRDQHLESLGYSVLRIPAKVVFNTPQEAVKRVGSALRVGKRPMPIQLPESGWQRLSATFTAIDNGIASMNAAIHRANAMEAALKDAKIAVESEQRAIKSAISLAQSELEMTDWLDSESAEMREMFEASLADIEQAINDRRSARDYRAFDLPPVQVFPAAPPPNDNPAHHEAIQEAYAQITASRAEFYRTQRLVVNRDVRMPCIVEKKLRDLGCGEYWELLNGADFRH